MFRLLPLAFMEPQEEVVEEVVVVFMLAAVAEAGSHAVLLEVFKSLIDWIIERQSYWSKTILKRIRINFANTLRYGILKSAFQKNKKNRENILILMKLPLFFIAIRSVRGRVIQGRRRVHHRTVQKSSRSGSCTCPWRKYAARKTIRDGMVQ